MIDDKQLSIYEVRVSIRYCYDTIELITARTENGTLQKSDIDALKRCKEELLNLNRYHWTISIL